MNAALPAEAQSAAMVEFELDGRRVSAQADETILQCADRLGVPIPRLCYMEGMRADGNCRACVVEIDGERVLAPSCCRAPKAGMVVKSASPRATHSQKMVLELLSSDMPSAAYRPDSELDRWTKQMQIGKPRFAAEAMIRLAAVRYAADRAARALATG